MRKQYKTTPQQRRRYRLHRKCKSVPGFFPRKREFSITEIELKSLNGKQNRAMAELRDRFGYNIQLTIR